MKSLFFIAIVSFGLSALLFVQFNKNSQNVLPQPPPSSEYFNNLNYAKKREVVSGLIDKDPVQAWAYLKQVAKKDGEVVTNVHEFAHMVGQGFYKKDGIKGIKNCDNDFGSGCFHGVTEMMLLTHGEEIAVQIERECEVLFPSLKDSNKDPGCIHGIGHGLLSYHGMDLSKALFGCDSLTSKYRRYCYNGVFMEYASSAVPTVTEGDPWSFCTKLSLSYQFECAKYLPQFLDKSMKFEISRFGEICMEGPLELREPCIAELGHRVSIQAHGYKESILRECQKIENQTGQTYCIFAGAQDVAFQKYQNWQETSMALCETLDYPTNESCLRSLKQI